MRCGRRDFAEDGDDVVLRDQLRDGVGRFFLLGLIVLGQHLDLASVDAAGGVDLVGRHHDAVVRRLAERGLRAGHRAVLADEDVAATAAPVLVSRHLPSADSREVRMTTPRAK